MWVEILSAIALVLVIEGIMPFLNPESWRQAMVHVVRQNDQTLRLMGLVSMIVGVGLLYTIR